MRFRRVLAACLVVLALAAPAFAWAPETYAPQNGGHWAADIPGNVAKGDANWTKLLAGD